MILGLYRIRYSLLVAASRELKGKARRHLLFFLLVGWLVNTLVYHLFQYALLPL